MTDFSVETVVIGAGVVGLATAYQLSKENKEVLILGALLGERRLFFYKY